MSNHTNTGSLPQNVFGETTGVNLTNKVKLNNNPLQIFPDSNIGGWNVFQRFLQAKGVVNDPSLNSKEGRKTLTDKLIEEFNSGNALVNGVLFDYVIRFPQNKITSDNIFKAQKYHKLSDNTVQIDGWVGSQTSQLIYPTPTAYYVYAGETRSPQNTQGWIPVTWGNQRFVLNASKLAQNKGLYSSKDLILYDEKIHGNQLQREARQFPSNWDTWGNNSSIANKSSSEINNSTRKDIQNRDLVQSQTKLIINSSKK